MRYSTTQDRESSTASDIVNNCSQYELESIIKRCKLFVNHSDDSNAELISKAICKARQTEVISTTTQLRQILFNVFPNLSNRDQYRKVMKVFMALRITVNDELLILDKFLEKDPINLLAANGSMVVLTFHSSEDKIVSDHFRRWQRRKYGEQVFKKVITPSELELNENPASASAKLRAFVRFQ